MPRAYTNFDARGCFPATELVGTCLGNNNAVGPTMEKGKCCYDVCGGLPVPCGRPLLIGGSPRIARALHRADWIAEISVAQSMDRAAIAWREDAMMEHASIASFAQLVLELLASGAPPQLIAAANRAALDEVEHAKICFSIAARLGDDGPAGPSPMSLEGLVLRSDLAGVAIESAAQSCVGETVAALSLARAAALSTADLAPLLSKMADDELEHAALGWEILAWACAQDARLRDVVKSALVVGDYGAPEVFDEDAWHACGRLTSEDMKLVVASAREIISEAAAQL